MRQARPAEGTLALGAALLAAGAMAMAAPGATAPPAAASESLYVIEQLVVNVNSAPDSSGERIATVRSGDRVAVIERLRDQVHVRLANGTEGWIRASYLSADEPLRPRLVAREAELVQLRAELTRVQGELAAAHASTPAAPARPGRSTTVAAGASAAEEAAAASQGLFFTSRSVEPHRLVWPWVLGGSLLSLALGLALGVVLLDRHIRRKFGGLRIY
jgi:SH3-like domain-containing protein